MVCDGCRVSLFQVIKMNYDQIVQWLLDHNIFKDQIICSKCGNEGVMLNRNSLTYCCYKRVSFNKQKKSTCGKRVSACLGSFFQNFKLPLDKYMQLVAILLHLRPPRHELIQREIGVSLKSVTDWFFICRKVFTFDALKNCTKIGGNGATVEIEEGEFIQTKHSQSVQEATIKWQWAFSGIELGADGTFYVIVQKRDTKTFMQVLEKWVEPNTLIVCDFWKSIAIEDQSDWDEFTINHSYEFKDKKTSQHNLNAKYDKIWGEVRSHRRHGERPKFYGYYLAEYQFKRRHKNPHERLHHFFLAAAELHPPTH